MRLLAQRELKLRPTRFLSHGESVHLASMTFEVSVDRAASSSDLPENVKLMLLQSAFRNWRDTREIYEFPDGVEWREARLE